MLTNADFEMGDLRERRTYTQARSTCSLHLANDIRIFAFFLASIFIGRRHSTPANANAFHVPASWHTLGKKIRKRSEESCISLRGAHAGYARLESLLPRFASHPAANIRHTMRNRCVLPECTRVGTARGYGSHRSIARIRVMY